MKRKIHELKCWPEFFAPLLTGRKPFEVRVDDDRGFEVGHLLHMREYTPSEGYTGRSEWFEVTYLVDLHDVPLAREMIIQSNWRVVVMAVCHRFVEGVARIKDGYAEMD